MESRSRRPLKSKKSKDNGECGDEEGKYFQGRILFSICIFYPFDRKSLKVKRVLEGHSRRSISRLASRKKSAAGWKFPPKKMQDILVRTEEAKRKASSSNRGRETETETGTGRSRAFKYHRVMKRGRPIAAVAVLEPAVTVLHPATAVLDPTTDELEDRLFLTEFQESESSRNLRVSNYIRIKQNFYETRKSNFCFRFFLHILFFSVRPRGKCVCCKRPWLVGWRTNDGQMAQSRSILE